MAQYDLALTTLQSVLGFWLAEMNHKHLGGGQSPHVIWQRRAPSGDAGNLHPSSCPDCCTAQRTGRCILMNSQVPRQQEAQYKVDDTLTAEITRKASIPPRPACCPEGQGGQAAGLLPKPRNG